MATYTDERGDRVSTSETERVVAATPAEARQGPRGQRVLMVLVGGLVLALIAWALVGTYGEAIDPDTAAPTQQAAPDTKAVVTPSDQRVIDNTPANGETMQTAPTDRDPTPDGGTGGPSQSVTP